MRATGTTGSSCATRAASAARTTGAVVARTVRVVRGGACSGCHRSGACTNASRRERAFRRLLCLFRIGYAWLLRVVLRGFRCIRRRWCALALCP